MSVRFIFGITCVRLLNIYDFASSSCFPGARIDLSAEDNVIALVLAECPARPYAELIKSDIPGPSNLRSARSTASRPSPPSTMGGSPIGPSVATPTRGELLAQLETLSRKPRSAKRKTSSSRKIDWFWPRLINWGRLRPLHLRMFESRNGCLHLCLRLLQP